MIFIELFKSVPEFHGIPRNSHTELILEKLIARAKKKNKKEERLDRPTLTNHSKIEGENG
jgi:hypothetical protein